MNTETHWFMAVDAHGRPVQTCEGRWKYLSATDAYNVALRVIDGRFEVVECSMKGIHFPHGEKH